MAIPLSYNVRNLRLRKSLTIMTALGIALTVTTAIFLFKSCSREKKNSTGFMCATEPAVLKHLQVSRKQITAHESFASLMNH